MAPFPLLGQKIQISAEWLPDILVLQHLLCSLPSLSEVLQEAGHHKIDFINNIEILIQVNVWI